MAAGPDVKLEMLPCCLDLRHKMMDVDVRHMTPGLVDDSSETRVFWCMRTQDFLGPDGEVVDPDACGSGGGRSCCTMPAGSRRA